MFGRPRCREWTPLATQQLRLRSLIQIVGYNIRPPEWCTLPCSFYLTLHHTTMSAPFYTSERICSPHPKWKEIDSETTHRVSSANVVIRIWCHILQSNDDTAKIQQDTVIQTWGVYFSGLRYIGANLASNFTSDCFKSNTLVFQMHGGYFCSYKSLKLDVIPPENEIEHGSLSSDSSGRTNLSKITLEAKHILNHKLVKESRSISPSKYSRKSDKEYSKSHSPVERGFQQNFPTLRTSASLNIGQSQRGDCYRRREENSDNAKGDPNHIYEYSPENLDVKEFTSGVNCDNFSQHTSQEDLSNKIDLSETAESYDLRNEADGVPKYRYMALNFLKSEIRPSYNATKLQKLHLLQYSIKKRQEAVQEIKERIYNKSALTNDDWPQHEDLSDIRMKFKSRSQRNLFSPEDDSLSKDKSSSQSDLSAKNGRIKEDRPIVSNGSRLTFSKLNDLLSFKAKPSPFQRSEHVRLTKQLEILRFKRIILSDERDAKLASIRRLKERHAKLFEENQDVGSELMQNYHSLSRRSEDVKETRLRMVAARELAATSHHALCAQRCDLLTQLHQIFYIEQKDPTTWTICGVPLPVCGDDNPRTNAVSDSVAAGFVAQATCLCAVLLNQPLRYKITLLGSASKITDVTPDLPDPNIPLFPRGGDITLFRYALFLLNKCIAQLIVGRGLPLSDIRPTLSNLQRLLTAPANMSDTTKLYGTYRWLVDSQCPRTQSLRSLVASERCKYRQFNRFKDSVDGQSMQSAMNHKRHRHSRSVGSYHDDQELPALEDSTTSIMGSESNIYNMKLTQADSSDLPHSLKSHNSDSEIHRLNDEEAKVVFTLGDDTTIDQQLVRLSTNNQDEIGENVKKICSEISDFCSSEISECVDIAKHIDIDLDRDEEINIAKYMERKVSEECESGVNDIEAVGVSVTDVIVIPSAEAILDTGQSVSPKEEGEQ
ncbi:UV-resistance associated gene isoform X2 [Anticarsia gemmatalis]|uniref:UV-resistance associated gene isoform X2 n=1 Tax=Anticarsia gemmatalis TaxID=129554 RepID=UPI003F758E54